VQYSFTTVLPKPPSFKDWPNTTENQYSVGLRHVIGAVHDFTF